MTREQAKKMLPLIRAFADGKSLQEKTDDGWEDIGSSVGFLLDPNEYRIKPEPRELRIGGDAYATHPSEAFGQIKIIHVKEVLE